MLRHSDSGFAAENEYNSWFHHPQQYLHVLKQQSSHGPCLISEIFLVLNTVSKRFSFCLINPQNIFLRVFTIIRKIFFCLNLRWVLVFFWSTESFSPCNSPVNAIFAQSLCHCFVLNSDLNWGKWGLHCYFGSFILTSWMSRHCPLGVLLEGDSHPVVLSPFHAFSVCR